MCTMVSILQMYLFFKWTHTAGPAVAKVSRDTPSEKCAQSGTRQREKSGKCVYTGIVYPPGLQEANHQQEPQSYPDIMNHERLSKRLAFFGLVLKGE